MQDDDVSGKGAGEAQYDQQIHREKSALDQAVMPPLPSSPDPEAGASRRIVRWQLLVGGVFAIFLAVATSYWLETSPSPTDAVPVVSRPELAGPTVEELQAQIEEMLDARQQEMQERLQATYDERLESLHQQLEQAQREAEARELARIYAEAAAQAATEENADPGPTETKSSSSASSSSIDPRFGELSAPRLITSPDIQDGTVTLRVLVGTQGQVEDIQQISAGEVSQVTLKSLKKTIYQPGTENGRPREMWTTISVPTRDVVLQGEAGEEHEPTTTAPRQQPSEATAGVSTSPKAPIKDHGLVWAWEELKEGRIAYEPERSMHQGQREEVRVRITEGQEIITSEGFRDEKSVSVEAVKLSGVMVAELIADERDFLIDRRSTAEQALIGDHVDWTWWVTPLRSGDLELTLRVTAKIKTGDSTEYTDMLVKTAQIHATANPAFRVSSFVKEHWKWLLGSPLVLGVLALIGRAAKRRKDRGTAGF